MKKNAEDSRPGPYLDYFTHVGRHGRLMESRFGIRVREGAFWAVIRIADKRATVFGKPHPIPVTLETLPQFVRNIIDDHMQEHPTCDLMDVLKGQKSFQLALGRTAKAQGSGA